MSNQELKACLIKAVNKLLTTNGGPIDGADTDDGKDYVMVRMDAFRELERVAVDIASTPAPLPVAEGAWRPIESAPKEIGKRILLSVHAGNPEYSRICIGYWLDGWEEESRHDPLEPRGYTVTHWQPMPPLPTFAPASLTRTEPAANVAEAAAGAIPSLLDAATALRDRMMDFSPETLATVSDALPDLVASLNAAILKAEGNLGGMSKEWFVRSAKIEGDSEVSAGTPPEAESARWETVWEVLNQIASGPRKTREQRLASSCVAFIEQMHLAKDDIIQSAAITQAAAQLSKMYPAADCPACAGTVTHHSKFCPTLATEPPTPPPPAANVGDWMREASLEIVSKLSKAIADDEAFDDAEISRILQKHAPGILGASPRTLEHWTNIRAKDLAELTSLRTQLEGASKVAEALRQILSDCEDDNIWWSSCDPAQKSLAAYDALKAGKEGGK